MYKCISSTRVTTFSTTKRLQVVPILGFWVKQYGVPLVEVLEDY
jgi:hypothetical protein